MDVCQNRAFRLAPGDHELIGGPYLLGRRPIVNDFGDETMMGVSDELLDWHRLSEWAFSIHGRNMA